MGYKDRAKTRAKVLAQGDNFKLREGENFVRILPTPESAEGAEDDVFYEVLMHNDIGAEKRFMRCGKDAHDPTLGDCYICDVVVPRLIANGNQETAKKLKPRWSGVVQALHMAEDNNVTGPHFWMVGGKLGKNLLMLLGQSNRDYASIKHGYWIYVNRTGSGLLTEYSAPIPDQDPIAVSQKYADILKPFEQLTELPVYSEQGQKDAWLGNRDAGQEKAQSPSSRRAGVMDEDEAPAPRSTRRAAVVDDDDTPAPRKPAPTLTKTKTKPVQPDSEEAVEEEPVSEGPTREDILASPPLKARDPITGDKRYKVEIEDGKFVAMTADGKPSPKGLSEGEEPTKPGKLWLKEHPAPVEDEVEESEDYEESEEPVERPTRGAKPSKPAVEPEEADDLPPRSTKGKASTQAKLPLDDDDPPVSKAKTATKAGTSKPKAAAAVVDDDEDPFGED